MTGQKKCKCDHCTDAAHCHGNRWIWTVPGKKRMCPKHSEMPLGWLRRRKVLSVGQADDLLFDNGRTRLWLSRCGVDDGEAYDNKVTVETLVYGRWSVYMTYQAR